MCSFDHVAVHDIRFILFSSSIPSDSIVNILYIVVRVPLGPPDSISFTHDRLFREDGKLSV